MQYLNDLNVMEQIFGRRNIYHHAGERGVVYTRSDSKSVSLVLDLEISKQILQSRHFSSFNYFTTGFDPFALSENPLEHVKFYFDHGPLFSEGDALKAIKLGMLDILKKHENTLDEAEPMIRAIIMKRRHRITSALDYTNLVLELCLAYLIQHTGSTSFRAAIQALRVQKNIFYSYPRLARLRVTDHALAILDRSMGLKMNSIEDSTIKLTVFSFVLMATDALLAYICASVLQLSGNMEKDPSAGICPVSYVPRQCVKTKKLNSIVFHPGDICFIALVAGKAENTADSLTFGAGPHVCIGKQIALRISKLALELAKENFPDGFSVKPLIKPDGTFLAFRNPS